MDSPPNGELDALIEDALIEDALREQAKLPEPEIQVVENEAEFDLDGFAQHADLDAFGYGRLAFIAGKYRRPLSQWHAALAEKE